MSLPLDATLKELVRLFPADYEGLLHLVGSEPGSVVNVDLSTVSAASDIVIAHGDPPASIVDLNFQSGPDPGLSDRILLYNALLRHRYGVPVHSVVVLLRPVADSPPLEGRVRYEGLNRRSRLNFTFEVMRLWRQPMKRLLTSGLGALPLAPLGQPPAQLSVEEALPDVIRRIDQRLAQETTPEESARLWMASSF